MIDTISARTTAGPRQTSADGRAAIVEGAPMLELPKRPNHFLTRQPILDLKQKLHGYSMLQRPPQMSDGAMDAATVARLAINDYSLFMPISPNEKGFVKGTRETLLAGLADLLPPQNTVLQLPPDLDPDAEITAICQGLRKKGYRFALEMIAAGESKHPLLEVADYLIVDFQAVPKDTRKEIFRMATGSRAKVVAANVEKTEQLEMARREGCQFFQGFFLASSVTAARRTIPTNQVILLRLMAALSEATTEIKQIESMVMMDTSLTYQLLRRVNSVMYSLNSRVTSIRSALVFVGNDEFRKLITVALADVFASTQSRVLIAIALERAKFCEILAPRLREQGPKLYLLGMLSLIDLILQVPMSLVMESLPIDADMKAALKGEQSPMGIALELVRSYQAANWDRCETLQQKLDMSESATCGTYMESVHWTALVLGE